MTDSPARPASPWTEPLRPARPPVILIFQVLIVALLFGGGAFASGMATGRAYGGRPQVASVPATAVGLGDGTTLRNYLLTPPPGATLQQIFDSSNGIQTVREYTAAYFRNPADETARLTGRRLAVVVSVRWTDIDGVGVEDHLLQFHDADGAESYLLGQDMAYRNDPTVTDTYTISGPADGFGYERNAPDTNGYRIATLICQNGRVVLWMSFTTKASFDRSAETALLKRQAAALTPETRP